MKFNVTLERAISTDKDIIIERAFKKFNKQNVDENGNYVKYSDLEGQQKGYYNIVECDSDGRGDVTPIVDDNEDLKVTRCYYNGGKISE